MTLDFREFLPKYFDNSIREDAAWRAYDILQSSWPSALKDALKYLGYMSGPSPITFGKVAADYGLEHGTLARHILLMWWVWRQISTGERKSGLKLRENNNER